MGDEAEAQISYLTGGLAGNEWGPADNEAHAAKALEADEVTAAELAKQLDDTIASILLKFEHSGCGLEEFANTSQHEGATVVVCGCGEFYPAPELGAPVALSPDRVDAHGPAAITVAAADPIARTLALIGPAEDYRPDQVERFMLDAIRRLEEGQAFERWALEQASDARSKYDRAYAKEFVLASGAMELRRNTAEVACNELAEARDRTDMVYRAAKAAMHNLRSTLSGYQSVLKSVQATYQTGGTSGGRGF